MGLYARMTLSIDLNYKVLAFSRLNLLIFSLESMTIDVLPDIRGTLSQQARDPFLLNWANEKSATTWGKANSKVIRKKGMRKAPVID